MAHLVPHRGDNKAANGFGGRSYPSRIPQVINRNLNYSVSNDEPKAESEYDEPKKGRQLK
jgi:hypothetical protein